MGPHRGREKRAGRASHVLSWVVVSVPDLSFGLSASVAALGGMNVMAHCVEALYAPDADPISSLIAEEGIRLLATGLGTLGAATSTRTAHADVLLGGHGPASQDLSHPRSVGAFSALMSMWAWPW
ncbi:iron-containing alcohol dehydrogenase [Spirillospora sp. NPDC000708]